MAINRKLIIAKPSVCGNRACVREGVLRQNSVIYHREGSKVLEEGVSHRTKLVKPTPCLLTISR